MPRRTLLAPPDVPAIIVVPSIVVDVNEVRPAIVVAVPPKETFVEPIVRALLASWLFGIALVPNSPLVEL